MPILSRRLLLALPLLPVAARAAAPLSVVASFSILADLVTAVGGARVQVKALVGPNQDLHEFEPRPSDAMAIGAADLFFVNGLGIEGWAIRLSQATHARRPPVVASRGVKARGNADGTDPHAWQDVGNAIIYVANIRDALAAADPAGAADYRAAAGAYIAQLRTLDAEVRATFAAIPRAQRRVVTTHDALGYYGAAYGIDFHAPQGFSTENEPSAKALAGLIAQVKREHIRALFLENVGPDVLLATVSRETGVHIGGQLFSDALSPPDGPAATYVAMIRHNTALLAEALR
jgi:zinc/manganese transport system substrate-binding protein